jgi:hypothetical protein
VVSVGGTVLIAGGTLGYCSSGSITGPPPPNAITASAAQPPRGSITSPTTSDITSDNNSSESSMAIESQEENKCVPEFVPVRSRFRVALFTSDTDIEHFRLQIQWVADGASLAGNVYHGSGTDSFIVNASSDPLKPRFETTHTVVERLISRTAPDMFVKYLLHMTMSATGQMTASVEKGSPVQYECR